ncbi:MAG: acetyl-CoA C-acyltransferase FadA [Planctomycetaceae bacterium TMED10]|nr:MAG: acetyl-CoA C-acyltransferase FadA [Planctomycetaceae bacterium TMED10]
MNSAVVVECVRSPVGRAHSETGFFRDVRADDLAVTVVEGLVEKSAIEPDQIEDCLMGNTQQQGEQGFCVARNIALMSGLPVHTGGVTINRLCGSSLQAVNQGAHAIMSGFENVQIVGGLEHMHHIPMDKDFDINPKLFTRTSKGALMMGVTAEFLAQTHSISREAQDDFALRSHELAAKATTDGHFKNEIIPVWGKNEVGERTLFDFDQSIRNETSPEALAKLKPAFMPGMGTVTAGNSSPLNDGAAAMLIMSEEKAAELGLRPLARITATAIAGVDPCVMGTGPVPATQKALQRANLSLQDIDLIELNEAFAAQALACVELLGMDIDRVNVAGGAIAIGHPLGASGARIATTLIHNMVTRGVRYGLATMCIGVGQGIATIFERIDN